MSLDTAVAALIRDVAATVILPRFQRLAASEVMEKSPGDLVTVADREAEARLTEGLAALIPGARVVGEEASAANPALLDRLDEGTLWLVDPLDGTLNFAAGTPPFAVMVALLDRGERQAAWIFDPVAGRMCHAQRGQGAFVDGQRIVARGTGRTPPVAALATGFMTPDRRAEVEAIAAGRLTVVPVPRCAGEQYPRLVLGANDLSLFERSLPWDHAPGALFLEEAGGRITRPDGTPYDVADGRRGLVAGATPAEWDVAMALFGEERR